MADLTISIKKSDVYEEVAKTTAYIGAKNKLEDGKSAFDQVFVTDADLAMIERFYNESVDTLMNLLKKFVEEINDEDGNINWKLTLSSRFDIKMEPSIIRSATSYLVNSIIGKWCEITAYKCKYRVRHASSFTNFVQDMHEATWYMDKARELKSRRRWKVFGRFVDKELPVLIKNVFLWLMALFTIRGVLFSDEHGLFISVVFLVLATITESLIEGFKDN